MRPFARVSGPVAPIALFVAIVAGSLATITAQQPVRLKQIISDTTAPAIDRGLRDADSPLPVRTASRTRWLHDARGGTYMRGSLVVRFRPGTSQAAQRAMLSQVSGTAEAPLPYADFNIVSLAGDDDPQAVAARLSLQPDVEYAQARYRPHAMFVPNDPLYPSQWNFPAIDMERAWDIDPGASSNITVAILDTGVAYRNALIRFNAVAWQREDGTIMPALGPVDVPFAAAPDLGDTSRFVAPWDFIWGDAMPLDFDGHGTHVTGTVGQATNNGRGTAGMAYNVRIMPVKVLDTEWDAAFNSPFVGTDDVLARAIRYAADNGAKVINMSLGRDEGGPAPVVRSAIEYAVSHGAFVVVAGGNEALEGNPVERYAEFAPQVDGMVAVGATGRNRVRASYSNIANYIELTAPGGDVAQGGGPGGILQQTYDLDLTDTFSGPVSQYQAPRFDVFAYYYFFGTSSAVPHVSGFAALLMQQGVTNPAAIEAVMKSTATDLGAPGRDNEYGYGLISPRAALRGMGIAK